MMNNNFIAHYTVHSLLKIFHMLPDGLKLFLRSFKKQEKELYSLKWFVEKSTIAVDIGANKGAYTYALSKLVGKRGIVVAVEPIEELARNLKRACNQLRLPVTVEQCCLSSTNRKDKLFIPSTTEGELLTGFASLDNKFGYLCEKRDVIVKCLDDLLGNRNRRVSFIKCDVEGHEIEVLKGGQLILKSDRPNLLIEIEQRHISESIDKHIDFILNYNYKGYFFDRFSNLRSINEFDVATYQSKKPENRLDYICNFIFLPNESPNNKNITNLIRL